MKRLKQKHFHLDLVRVGTDSNGLLSPTDEQNLDCAVQMAREIYRAIGVGIGRVNRWWLIALYDNTGFDVIDDDCEASDLIDEFDAPGARNRRVSGALLGRRRGWAYARGGRIKREGPSWHGTNLLASAGSLLHLIPILVSLR
jgi:hypothetical protein